MSWSTIGSACPVAKNKRAISLDFGGQELDAAYSVVDTKTFLVDLVLSMGDNPRLVSSRLASAILAQACAGGEFSCYSFALW